MTEEREQEYGRVADSNQVGMTVILFIINWWKHLLIICIAAAVFSAIASYLIKPQYKSTASVFAVKSFSTSKYLTEGPQSIKEDYMDIGDEDDIEKLHLRLKQKGVKVISEVDEDKERKTRTVNGSCIFLNRKGEFSTFGCVLHHLAEREGSHFKDVKPDVCWQLPIRRSFEVREYGEREIHVTVIGEYERLAWGDGGADFNWYCTGNTEAHDGSEPVYLSNRMELIAMMGEAAYEVLSQHCANRLEIIKSFKQNSLPLLAIHPATLAAKK